MMGVHHVGVSQSPSQLWSDRMGGMSSEQAKPVEDPDAQAAGILPGLRAIAEGDELAGEVAGRRPSQLQRVSLPAAEEPARPERGG